MFPPKRYFPKIPRGFKGFKTDPETFFKASRAATVADILSRRNQPKSAAELDHENFILRIVRNAQKASAQKARTQRAARLAEVKRKAEEKSESESEDRMKEEEFVVVQKESAELRKMEAENEIKMAEYKKQRAEEKMKKAEDKKLRAEERFRKCECELKDFTEVQNLEDKRRIAKKEYDGS